MIMTQNDLTCNEKALLGFYGFLPSQKPIQDNEWDGLFPEESALPEKHQQCICSTKDLMIRGCSCRAIIRWNQKQFEKEV